MDEPDGGIATLAAPPPRTVGGYPLSNRTGEPRRPALVALADALLLVGSLISAAALVSVLWRAATVTGYYDAARIFGWQESKVVSWQTFVLVLLVGLIGVATVGAPAVAAYNAWNGHRWTRWFGIGAVVVTGLTFLLNAFAPYALVPVVIGAALLWLRPVTSYVDAWRPLRPDPYVPQQRLATGFHYGPLPRYRSEL